MFPVINDMREENKVLDSSYKKFENILSGQTDDINGRVRLARISLDRIIENPFSGIGWGNTREYNRMTINIGMLFHNTVLAFWTELGVFGLLFMLGYFYSVINEIKTQLKRNKKYGDNFCDLAIIMGYIPFSIMLFVLDNTGGIWFNIITLISFTYERNKKKGFADAFMAHSL